MEFLGIHLNVEFVPGRGGVHRMPNGPGIYAEIHRPTHSIRIGESQNVRSRNLAHIAWAEKHKLGKHDLKEAARRGDIVELAKKWGANGLEHFIVSDDRRLADRSLRVACEIHLHDWARRQTLFVNLNRQRSYRIIN